MKQQRGKVAPKCADKDPEGRPLCGCGCGKRPEGRRTVWFSSECQRCWMLLWHIKSQRSHVFARDGGKCQTCGGLPEQLRAATRGVGYSYQKTAAENAAIRATWEAARAAAHADGWPRGNRSWWEMDHIVELADGGTNDLANLRVLCYRCHKAKTRAARAARSSK